MINNRSKFLSLSDFVRNLDEGSNYEEISADFTPHEEFHRFRWLSPHKGAWYYKMKDFKPCVLPKNPKFIDSLDSELKKVVGFLHSKKIPTTPSCAGHFCNPAEWDKKYDMLKTQEEFIRERGLELIDPEDGKKFVIKDKNYSLPWNKKSFIERASEHSKFGVLGIYDPGNFFAKKITRGSIPNSQIKKDGNITLFLTSPKSNEDLIKCWKKFTNSIIENPLS